MPKTQFVTDEHGKKLPSFFLSLITIEKVDGVDELEEIKRYDAAKKGDQKFIEAEQAFK